MADELKTRKEPQRKGWYWQMSDDSGAFGPSKSRRDAEEDFWNNGGQDMYSEIAEEIAPDTLDPRGKWLADYEYITQMESAPISTDIFSGAYLLEDMEERNEEAVWDENSPTNPGGEAIRELELMLADALYRWCEKHDYWAEFRGLQ